MDDGTASTPGRPRPGGRTARTTEAVLRATIDLFVEGGWDAVRTEAVARRAGVHKTTVYRRWPTRGALIAAALAARPYRTAEELAPDTGSLRSDLATLVAGQRFVLADARTRAVVQRMSEATFDPELAAAVRAFWASSIERATAILRRAIDRGELAPDAPIEVVATMFIGAGKLQVLDADLPTTDGWFDALLDATLAALDR